MDPIHHSVDLGAESGEDLQPSTAALEARLAALRERRRELDETIGATETIKLALDEADLLTQLERYEEAHEIASPLLSRSVQEKSWSQAVQACDTVFRCGLDDALAALGQGVWLSVTFPVDLNLTLTMLQHIIDETPDDSDGAAVAAATAVYVVDLRAEGKTHQDLGFFAMQMMGTVARRHGNIENQDDFDAWAARLELTNPERFLVRLRNVVDVLVQDDWSFDQEQLRAEIPVQ
jgi:hypothetical protein